MNRDELLAAYREVRGLSRELVRPLAPEVWRIQSMPDVSPPWWNLGHTSWFFARNVLAPWGREAAEDGRLEFVLNSYYESVGPRIERHRRGSLTRPSNDEVLAYRASVDERMEALIGAAPDDDWDRFEFLVTTGLHHEQQHQELLLTEVKHILATDPYELRATYAPLVPEAAGGRTETSWIAFEGGLVEIGNVEGGWCWDNELPVHKSWLDPFALASRLVTAGEYVEFIEDGGYEKPLLWLANGWAQVKLHGWNAPLYWRTCWDTGDEWAAWTLSGERKVDSNEPVSHVSFYEADAYARWKGETDDAWRGARLPTEREWEHGARLGGFDPAAGNHLENRAFHPLPAPAGEGLKQMAGDLWEWTTNHYEPYPGYAPFDGNLMEYNGKFMDNQRVLRGGSCATPRSHIRPSYRNFWPADTRFQLTGIRLAKED
ncbi:MAG TPA: ergothioneine biosynthesis protein EgtB [Thermoanaerobaculia bacterium]|jgi:ergothioneine biosynthesis protein EgtB|nr:ergothioneine biosynthesis protein EgtB [Thermoanaerobaculia bacterium]